MSDNGGAQPMVELRTVTKEFQKFTAVQDVSLSIRSGEFITLLGPSGCGKTTLLRMISGFEVPTRGQILLDGTDVTHRPPYRRDVNQVFQSYALFPHMTVRDNIGFGLKMKKVAKAEAQERIQSAIAMVSLAGFEERKPSQLSGGQRQRVALARAIVCRPKVLLLDEPLSALDAKLRHSMQVELKRLQQKLGITFVFVTHDQEEALTMSDRIAVINKGRIEQLGDAAAIYHQPKTTFVANFIGQANILEVTVVSRKGRTAKVALKGGLELTVRADELPEDATTGLISIRPEKIMLRKARDPEAVNCFEAEVAEEIFRGSTDQMLLRTESGLELTAMVANEGTKRDVIHRGDKVFCHLDDDDIVIVQDT
jgi:spermidine/putrescine transport system ATP-binding protein